MPEKNNQPPKAPKTNTIAIYFQVAQTDGGQLKRGQTDIAFDAEQFPSLLVNDVPTATGYEILIQTLTEVLVLLTEKAGENPSLNSDALKRKSATRISGARRLKLIGV